MNASEGDQETIPDVEGMPTTAVSLSGGGVRASIFALGVLLYLVRAGLNRQVRVIASVSGGSITSAAIASLMDFSKVTEDSFVQFTRALGQEFSMHSTFFLPKFRVFFWMFVTFA